MQINRISFGKLFPTREVAKIVSGEQCASVEFLEGVTGIPKSTLLSQYSSDIITAGSSYCANKIAESHPEFQKLKNIGASIRDMFHSFNNESSKKDIECLRKLSEERDEERKAVCNRLGEIIDIEPIKIPFFYKQN